MEDLKVNNLIESLSHLNKLFDVIRIIDPRKNKIINYHSDQNIDYASTCYQFWKQGKKCSNCVSNKAYKKHDTFIKVEYKEDLMFMIIASPIKLSGTTYVVEMIKDITKTGIIAEIDGKNIEETGKVITSLNKKVITDELTKLYNRRYINEQLPSDILNATKLNQGLAVIMLDIDRFKNINDTYGHIAGDFVIRKLSQIMRKHVQCGKDWVARYGGEEFLIVVRNADKESSYKIAENIRTEISKTPLMYGEIPINVTLSTGVYVIKNGDTDWESVINKVDKNLYQAKQEGRNKTVVS